ncbi:MULTISPECIES: RhuM family protein [unclassified Corynebacterium]|uniref:RhuM family protein n=1 Tax=unclassified Corynebacterium TaxID=2624378 RepID=UPI003F9348B1
MTQAQVAQMFGVSVPTISAHFKNILEKVSLTSDRTVRKLQTVRSEGDRTIRRDVTHYNLDAILAVGYRVRDALPADHRRILPLIAGTCCARCAGVM